MCILLSKCKKAGRIKKTACLFFYTEVIILANNIAPSASSIYRFRSDVTYIHSPIITLAADKWSISGKVRIYSTATSSCWLGTQTNRDVCLLIAPSEKKDGTFDFGTKALASVYHPKLTPAVTGYNGAYVTVNPDTYYTFTWAVDGLDFSLTVNGTTYTGKYDTKTTKVIPNQIYRQNVNGDFANLTLTIG